MELREVCKNAKTNRTGGAEPSGGLGGGDQDSLWTKSARGWFGKERGL